MADFPVILATLVAAASFAFLLRHLEFEFEPKNSWNLRSNSCQYRAMRSSILVSLMLGFFLTCKLAAQHGVEVENPTEKFTVSFSPQARPDTWQFSGVELKDGDTATITATGGWHVVGDNPPYGNGEPAGPTS
jgi:hypothetical protein